MSALYTCHVTSKIVHRDIKPENLMLDEAENMILVDFGEAHVYDGEDDQILDRKRNNGSPLYKAPECYRTKIKDRVIRGRQLDIWAAGFTLYELATGMNPFPCGGDRWKLQKMLLETEVDYSMF